MRGNPEGLWGAETRIRTVSRASVDAVPTLVTGVRTPPAGSPAYRQRDQALPARARCPDGAAAQGASDLVWPRVFDHGAAVVDDLFERDQGSSSASPVRRTARSDDVDGGKHRVVVGVLGRRLRSGRLIHGNVEPGPVGGRGFPPLSLHPPPSRAGRGGTGGDAEGRRALLTDRLCSSRAIMEPIGDGKGPGGSRVCGL